MKIKFNSLDEWLTSKKFLCVFSLLLSFMLWFYVVGNRNEEIAKTFEVPIGFLNPPAELSLFPSVRTAVITLNGERRAINTLDPSQLVTEVDLRGLGEGRHTLPIRFKVPSRMSVAQITPKDLEIELARIIEKDLMVRVLPPEDMQSGYIMDGAEVSPKTVKARGRKDQLSSIYEISVRPTIEELFSGGSWRIPLRAPDGVELEFSPADVTVSATYYQGMPRKELPVEVRTRGILPPSLRLISATVVPESLPVEGREEAFNQVLKLYTEPINLARLTKSTTVQTKIAELPAGLSLLSNPVVSVSIELKRLSDTKEFEQVPIEIRGDDQEAGWLIEPSTVTVTIEGALSAIQNLTLKDLGFSAYIDVSNVVTQSMRLPVRLQYKEIAGIDSISVEPTTAKITRQSN